MSISVERKIISGTSVFEFEEESPDYLVYNFSDDFVLASFEENMTDTNSVKIPSMVSRVVYENKNDRATYCTAHKKIYVQGTGEVEVQQLWH